MAKLQFVLCVALLVSVAFASQANWDRETDAGDVRPVGRSSAVMGAVDRDLVLFGGFQECFDVSLPNCDNVFFGDTWEYDISGGWTQIVTAVAPESRAFHGGDTYEAEDLYIMYGGLKYNKFLTSFTFFSDLWSYNPSTNTWALIPQTNAGPGVRIGMGIAIDGHTLYFFGGLDGFFQSHNDMWTFNLQTHVWTLIAAETTNPGVPNDRYIFQFEMNRPHGDKIFVHGGNFSPAGSGEQRHDSWIYTIGSGTWTNITGNFPGRIHGAGGARNNDFILAFGDVNDNEVECITNELSGGQNPVDEVFRYKTGGNAGWTQLFPGGSPGPLKRVASAVAGNTLYVWGGYNFICNADRHGGFPVYNQDVYSMKMNAH